MSLRKWLSLRPWSVLGSAACLAIGVAQVPPKTTIPATKKKTLAAPAKAAPKPPEAPKQDTDEEKFAKRAARLWSLQPVRKPEVPTGVTKSANPIDAFIAETWQSKGLRPTAKADRATLLRRVSFDLTGLPPSAAEQEAFLQDEAPDAYAKVVDRLLKSDQHGVRWA